VLPHAVARGHEATVRLLTDKAAKMEAVDDGNRTALLATAEEGHKAIVPLLEERKHILRQSACTESQF
jgi:ankyrin repeat protein